MRGAARRAATAELRGRIRGPARGPARLLFPCGAAAGPHRARSGGREGGWEGGEAFQGGQGEHPLILVFGCLGDLCRSNRIAKTVSGCFYIAEIPS